MKSSDRRQQRQGRRGYVFSIRVTDEQRAKLEKLRRSMGGPRKLGPWLLWRTLEVDDPDRYYPGDRAGSTEAGAGTTTPGRVVPTRPGSTGAPVLPAQDNLELVVPGPGAGTTPTAERLILDLCAGSGSWSAPYEAAGYRVVRVTLPEGDVRTWIPPDDQVWGILAAPPCTQFSLARNGHPDLARDFSKGMEIVNACMRVILQCRPRWWALENPVGLLSRFLGTARDTWEPYDFGDPWTKRTAIWGDYEIPRRGPFVDALGPGPYCTACDSTKRSAPRCSNPDHVAMTPPGFARAFFEANP